MQQQQQQQHGGGAVVRAVEHAIAQQIISYSARLTSWFSGITGERLGLKLPVKIWQKVCKFDGD